MAIIEFSTTRTDKDTSISTERLEVRPWALGGQSRQEFSIGSGANFDATGNVWLEVAYWVQGVQFFYTRNFLHMFYILSASDRNRILEDFLSGASDSYGFGDMLPETGIFLKRLKHPYRDQNHEEQIHTSYELELFVDVGAVMGAAGPGERMFNLKFNSITAADGIRFMQDLTNELIDIYEGKHPNPAELAKETNHWPFIREINQKAYDAISQNYDEQYFSNLHLTGTFDSWLENIPAGGHILDAGCGHGRPVITRLLEKGFRVTGTDLSPKMLARAREYFPGVTFLNQMASELTFEAEFDGVCSFSSLLYLDPIDLSQSLHRIHCALKPGGYLFLHGFDLHPGYRGHPYHVELDQWMWSWTYGIEEATKALEEHGFFRVLQARDVSTEEDRQERLESWKKYMLEQHEQLVKQYPHVEQAAPDLSKPPSNLAYPYSLIAIRQP